MEDSARFNAIVCLAPTIVSEQICHTTMELSLQHSLAIQSSSKGQDWKVKTNLIMNKEDPCFGSQTIINKIATNPVRACNKELIDFVLKRWVVCLKEESLVRSMWTQKQPKQGTTDKEAAHNQCLASLFMVGIDQACCKATVDESNNNSDCDLGKDADPVDVPAAVMMLTSCQGHCGSHQRQAEILSGGFPVVSFAQQQIKLKGKTECFWCNKEGHIARDCATNVDGARIQNWWA